MSEEAGPDQTLLTTDGEAAANAVTEPAPPPSVAPAEVARRHIGRYQLVRSIGAGGMGVVWEAIDPELGRGVAIKLLREERRAGLADRLRREAQALARLHHPNVVAVYDVGVDDGELYIVMQLVAGTTVDRVLQSRSLTRGEIIALLAQAGRGLAAAHGEGIVHRDFKPSNVLVDDDGIARVSDFGLARASDAAAELAPDEGSSLVTTITHGELVGTPAYMAPEQFLGGPVTAATDQFAFCVTLWEALAGERPFRGRTVAALREDVLSGRRPVPPATIPRRVRGVLLRGLALAPADRFPSMEALLAELAPSHTLLWAAGAVGIAAVATALTFIGTRESPPDPCAGIDASLLAGHWDAPVKQRLRDALGASYERVAGVLDRYAAGWVASRAQACIATHVQHEQSSDVFDRQMFCLDDRAAELGAVASALASAPRTPLTADKAIGAALALAPLDACADREQLLEEVPPPADLGGRASAILLNTALAHAEAQFEVARLDDARITIDEIVAQTQKLDYAPLVSEALRARAKVLVRSTKFADAATALHEAAIWAARGKDDDGVAQTYVALVTLQRAQRKFEGALAMEPFARTALARTQGNGALAATLETTLAASLRDLGRLDEADARYAAALAAVPASMPGRRADILMSRAVFLKGRDRHEEALAGLLEAQRLYRDVYGDASYKHATLLYNLSRQHRYLHQCEDAKRTVERSLEIYGAIIGLDSPDLVLDYISFGELAAECLHDLALARTHFTKAIEIAERAKSPWHHVAIGSYGHGLVQLERFAEAEPLLRRALDIATATKDVVNEANFAQDLAQSLTSLGRPDEAIPLLELAAKTYEGAKAASSHAMALGLIGQAQIAAKRPQRAIAPYEKAIALFESVEHPAVREAQFGLARALWDSGGDRTRAVELARRAEAGYRAGDGHDHDLAAKRDDVQAWLRTHAP